MSDCHSAATKRRRIDRYKVKLHVNANYVHVQAHVCIDPREEVPIALGSLGYHLLIQHTYKYNATCTCTVNLEIFASFYATFYLHVFTGVNNSLQAQTVNNKYH